MWQGENKPANASVVNPAQELAALLAQSSIDPLTRYLQRYYTDPSRAANVEKLQLERERRCANVVARYNLQPQTATTLANFETGYQFSCPAEVEAFAQQLANSAYRECYLVTKLHNFTQSLRLCRDAAEQGDPKAQLNMAISSRAMQDYSAAFSWAQGITAHFPAGSYLLGQLYEQGLGVQQDHVEAARQYRVAASQGYPAAQTSLGKMYLQGSGLESDPLLAKEWLLKAARQKETEALLYLGEISERGLVAAPDLPQAMVWYDLANQKGVKNVRDRILKLSDKLDVDKFIQAQLLVDQQLKGKP